MTIVLQVCDACAAVQFPERVVCRHCLADRLAYRRDSGRGVVLAQATITVTLDPGWSGALPCRVGTVLLDAGVQMLALLSEAVEPFARVKVGQGRGPRGTTLMIARKDH